MDPIGVELVAGQELPDITITWRDSTGAIINFASGFTWQLKVNTPTVTTKTTGITGASADPNVTISFTADEWASVPAGTWDAQLRARRTSDSKDRYLPLMVRITAAI